MLKFISVSGTNYDENILREFNLNNSIIILY